ncbi:hypothetical protein [Thiomonas sp. Bio17B3]|uniref:hypothetical protein n=1 Tax=Thiomonas sp. Bio17B3 TaxID=2493108 RepID=UPI001562C30B|nr:hypothetical protein [Thiomonas sp. Bio17B3]
MSQKLIGPTRQCREILRAKDRLSGLRVTRPGDTFAIGCQNIDREDLRVICNIASKQSLRPGVQRFGRLFAHNGLGDKGQLLKLLHQPQLDHLSLGQSGMPGLLAHHLTRFLEIQPLLVDKPDHREYDGQPEQHANRGFAQGSVHRGLLHVIPALNECRPVRRPEMRMRCMDEMKECPAGATELS